MNNELLIIAVAAVERKFFTGGSMCRRLWDPIFCGCSYSQIIIGKLIHGASMNILFDHGGAVQSRAFVSALECPDFNKKISGAGS